MPTPTEANATLIDYFDKRAAHLIDALRPLLQEAALGDDGLAGRLAGGLREALATGAPAPLLAAAPGAAPAPLARLLRRGAFAALRPADADELERGWRLIEQIADLLDRAAEAGATPAQSDDLLTFKALVDNALDGIGLSSTDGEVLYSNAAFAQMGGFGDQIVGGPVSRFLTPESGARLAEEVLPQLAERGSWQGQLRYLRPDGSTWLAQASIFIIADRDGAPLNRAIIVRDISEQHQQEQRLRFFRALAENAPYSIGIIDGAFRELYANPAYHAMLGYGQGDMVDMDARDFLVSDIAGEVWQQLHTHGWWQGSLTMRRAEGDTLQADGALFVIPGEHDQPDVVGAVLRDVTAELADQTQLQLTKERLEQMFATMPLAAVELDLEGRALSWNRSAERMFGWSADEVVGRPAATYIIRDQSPEQAHTIMMGALQRSSERVEQHTNYTRDGQALICRWYSNAIRNASGQVVGYLGLAEDVTELVQREEERERLHEQIISVQREALRELSTPLIPVADDVVVMPLIGSIDSGRAQQVVEALLNGVAETHARMAIVDITGVSIVDTQVADTLLRAAQAVRLLGAQTVLTGIRPEVAQTLTGLGVDMGQIITRSTLQSGIAFALQARR